MIKKKPKRSLAEINEQSKQLKRKRKHKGLASGSRFNNSNGSVNRQQKEAVDPRIGSKKAVPLIVDIAKTITPKKDKEIKKLSPEQELKQLEDDPYLEKLLDLVDDGEELDSKQQQDLNKILDRIDVLMNKLGLSVDDESEEDDFIDNTKEDIVSLLKQH